MKHCPKCNRSYADETLQFCLDDGVKLLTVGEAFEEPTTVFSRTSTSGESRFTTAQAKAPDTFPGSANFTAAMPDASVPIDAAQNNSIENQPASELSKTSAFLDKSLPMTAIVLALAHNYWQWLYMSHSRAFEFPDFLWSINFLIWFFLLAGGTAAAIFALKKSANKTLAIISLVVLAINFLLCIVPRRTY